jgi:hypothetical protein
MKKDFWPIDGTQHHILDKKNIYTNTKISNFLDNDSTRIIIAAKGMGKTLLLRSKKFLLETESTGALIIPRGHEYDLPSLNGTLPHESGYENISFWKDVWECSIICSVISHRTFYLKEKKEDDPIWDYIEGLDIDRSFKACLTSSIVEKKQELPSYFLNEILTRNLSTIQQFIRSFNNLYSISEKYITDECNVFIDAFDQTLYNQFPYNLQIWKNAQLGLAHASNSLNIRNRHIKVYVSVRQEAYSGFNHDDREVIKGSSLLLNYKEHELKEMLTKAIKTYTSHKTIESFCHLSEVKYQWCDDSDEIFKYIYRHSSLTPRSIIYLGKAIAELGLDNNKVDNHEQLLRNEINEAGASHIYKEYLLDQKKIFLKTLNSEQSIRQLLSLIPSNVLSGKAISSINKKFAELLQIKVDSSHPFCELYNIGLLGTIKQKGFKKIQYFRKPFEFDWSQHNIIKEDSTYFIHPSLQDEIRNERSTYYLNPFLIIGEGREWKNGKLLPTIFISHSSKDKSLIDKYLLTFEKEISLKIPSNFWYDKWNIPAGGNIHRSVENGITDSDFVIVFISKNSIESGWVEKEWQSKHNEEIETRKIQVIVVIIDETQPKELPPFLLSKKALLLREFDDSSEMFRILSSDIANSLNEINNELISKFL